MPPRNKQITPCWRCRRQLPLQILRPVLRQSPGYERRCLGSGTKPSCRFGFGKNRWDNFGPNGLVDVEGGGDFRGENGPYNVGMNGLVEVEGGADLMDEKGPYNFSL